MLYLYHDGDDMYWGTYTTSSWLFRRKKIQLGRWYITSKFSFRIYHMPWTKYHGGGLIAEIRIKGRMLSMNVDPQHCYYIAKDLNVSLVESQHKAARLRFRGFFHRRLIECGNSYFVPLTR